MAKPPLLQYKEFSNPFVADTITQTGMLPWQIDWLKKQLRRLTLTSNELQNLRFMTSRNAYMGDDGETILGQTRGAAATPEDTVILSHDGIKPGVLAHELQHVRDLRHNRKLKHPFLGLHKDIIDMSPYLDGRHSDFEERGYTVSEQYDGKEPETIDEFLNYLANDNMPRAPYSLADTLLLYSSGMRSFKDIADYIGVEKKKGY